MVHDSIGKALEAIPTYQLPADLASAVHDAASAAFFSGMQVAVWVGASVVLCAAFIAYRYLPARAARATTPSRPTRPAGWRRSTTASSPRS